ncbi:hypothetical protein [Mycobacteroides abscessus]|nr:hypothetical protein [Mycobacteroides abscessus]
MDTGRGEDARLVAQAFLVVQGVHERPDPELVALACGDVRR